MINFCKNLMTAHIKNRASKYLLQINDSMGFVHQDQGKYSETLIRFAKYENITFYQTCEIIPEDLAKKTKTRTHILSPWAAVKDHDMSLIDKLEVEIISLPLNSIRAKNAMIQQETTEKLRTATLYSTYLVQEIAERDIKIRDLQIINKRLIQDLSTKMSAPLSLNNEEMKSNISSNTQTTSTELD